MVLGCRADIRVWVDTGHKLTLRPCFTLGGGSHEFAFCVLLESFDTVSAISDTCTRGSQLLKYLKK